MKEKNWATLSAEIGDWALANYGTPSTEWQLLLGVIEEVAEFLTARDANNRPLMIDSLGDQAVYTLNLCRITGLDVDLDAVNRKPGARQTTLIDLVKSLGDGAGRGILKMSQGIRGFNDHMKLVRGVQHTVDVWARWAHWQTELYALPTMLLITNQVWESVSKRDWKANPLTGITSEKQ